MKIEAARPEHYEAVCQVLAEGDAALREQLPDIFCAAPEPVRPREFLLDRMAGPESVVLLALEEAEVVGVLELVMSPPPRWGGRVPRRVALLDNVVVRADRRGRGIGSQLMEHAERWAAERGAVAMELHVWSTNTSARQLYERRGYVTRLMRMEREILPLEARCPTSSR
jgi:GNAT superfamily N-acetyltransferase